MVWKSMTCTCTTFPSKTGDRSMSLAPVQALDRHTVQFVMGTSWWWLGVVATLFASVMCGALIHRIFVGPRGLRTRDLGKRDKATVPPLSGAACSCLEVAR
mmetsp:Transcript_37725/g.46723  ORF Transcript_37725/g.46723 Transcript_37725/m.46723 type:complete len:101 (+) Transcript_37725:737-1039(+)